MKELAKELYGVLSAMCTEINDGTVHGMPQDLMDEAEKILQKTEKTLKG